MYWALVAAHVLLPASVAGVAAWGALRCVRLLKYGRDPRLLKLAWFYGLFAASLVPMAIRTGMLAASVDGALPLGDMRRMSQLFHGEFVAAQSVDALLFAHHALMVVSLAVAVQAFANKRSAIVAAAALAVFAPFLWVALAGEAALTLYLAVLAILNHRTRRTPGALRVATGFVLFFLGHLSFLLLYHPMGTRTPIGDVLSLVALLILVRLLPRPTA